jgi:prepilin-type N-terminal cleavage/methylation domain-containing protein
MRRASNGFTIVELMVAMVIFMIICAIAIPNYMSATQRAHEAVAVSYLRQVQTGEEAYRLNNQEYTGVFAKLQPYISADLVQPALPELGLGDLLVSTAYAEPIPPAAPQGNSGSAPGQGGSSPGNSGSAPGQGGSSPGNSGSAPGQGGSSPGNSGSAPGHTGSTPGQGGSNPGQGGSSGGSTGTGTAVSDTKVYTKYIFQLTLTDPSHWSCTAEPVRDRLTSKFFYTDQTDVIRVSVGSLADSLSSQL